MILKTVKSCCGNSIAILQLPKAFRKDQIQPFLDAGYTIPPHYLKLGVVYIEKPGITVTGSYGNTKLHLKSSKPDLITEFQDLLTKATT